MVNSVTLASVLAAGLRGLFLGNSGERSFKFDHSYFNCNQLRNLKPHKLGRGDRKPHKCIQCDFAFTKVGHLKVLVLAHSKQGPFSCCFCPNTFTSAKKVQNNKGGIQKN